MIGTNSAHASNVQETGTAIDYEYGAGYFTTRNGTSWTASGGKYVKNTCDNQYLFVFKKGTSKSNTRYADIYKNGYFLVDGKSILVDTRVYVWTNINTINASFQMETEKGYKNFSIQPVQICNESGEYCRNASHRTALSTAGVIYMEFHFYKSGHVGESNYELSNVKGCSKLNDIDGNTSNGYGYEAWGVEKGTAVTYYKTSSSEIKSATTLPKTNLKLSSGEKWYYGTVDSADLSNKEDCSIYITWQATTDKPLTLAYNGSRYNGSNWQVAYGSNITRSEYYIKYNIIGEMPCKNPTTQYLENEITPDTKYINLYTKTNSKEALENINKYTEITGYTFSGWYTDSDLTKKYVGTDKTTTNTNLYGKYEAKKINISLTTVADEDNSYKLQNCEYYLYKLICKDTSHNHEEDTINTQDKENSCYEFIKKYTTDTNGKITLENLDYPSQYKLVETKTVENRLLPSGQWNIVFTNNENDYTIKTDGLLIKINTIEKAPPVKIDQNDEAMIPNKLNYQLPLTGGEGTNIFIITGTIIVIVSAIYLNKKIKAATKPKLNNNKIISRER